MFNAFLLYLVNQRHIMIHIIRNNAKGMTLNVVIDTMIYTNRMQCGLQCIPVIGMDLILNCEGKVFCKIQQYCRMAVFSEMLSFSCHR